MFTQKLLRAGLTPILKAKTFDNAFVCEKRI